MTSTQPLVAVRDLKTHFIQRAGTVRAVDGVSLDIQVGQTVGLVGESGCGKSMMARTLMRIAPRSALISGEMRFQRRNGQLVDLAQLAPMGEEMRDIRGAEIAMIFQEPMSSFSPDWRSDQAAPKGRQRRGAPPHPPRIGNGGDAQPGTQHRSLSPPAFRRAAAARHDRTGAVVPSRAADCR